MSVYTVRLDSFYRWLYQAQGKYEFRADTYIIAEDSVEEFEDMGFSKPRGEPIKGIIMRPWKGF